MKTPMKSLLGLALASLACGTVLAAPPQGEDPILASFERMLNHEPTPMAPINLAKLDRQGVDPLTVAVNQQLWLSDPPQYHIPLTASLPTQPRQQ